MNRKLFYYAAAAWVFVGLWAVGIYYVSTLSGQEIQKIMPLELWDKFLHFLAFSIGGVLIAAALRLVTRWSWRVIIPVTALAVSLYGVSDEWHQKYTKGRAGGDVGDWTADTLGGLAGAAACASLAQWRARRQGRGFRESL